MRSSPKPQVEPPPSIVFRKWTRATNSFQLLHWTYDPRFSTYRALQHWLSRKRIRNLDWEIRREVQGRLLSHRDLVSSVCPKKLGTRIEINRKKGHLKKSIIRGSLLTKPEPPCYVIRVFVSVPGNALQFFQL